MEIILFRTRRQVNAKGNQRCLTRGDHRRTLRGEVKKNVSKNAINNQQERRDRRQLTARDLAGLTQPKKNTNEWQCLTLEVAHEKFVGVGCHTQALLPIW